MLQRPELPFSWLRYHNEKCLRQLHLSICQRWVCPLAQPQLDTLNIATECIPHDNSSPLQSTQELWYISFAAEVVILRCTLHIVNFG